MSESRQSRVSRSRRPTPPTPEQYAEFIGQIDLVDLWLVEGQIRNAYGQRAPGRAEIAVTSPGSTWERTSGGFSVSSPYVVRFADGETIQAEISATFGLHFSSGQPMTDAIFAVFKDVNLPVNTWPFLREFVSTSLGRMGWLPFTLPAFKIGVRDSEATPDVDPTPKKRQRPRSR